jgi:hypothetical protein
MMRRLLVALAAAAVLLAGCAATPNPDPVPDPTAQRQQAQDKVREYQDRLRRLPEPAPDPADQPDPDPAPDADSDGGIITGRVGARCVDGNLSSATGQGACSHHGGVAAWLISDCTVDDFAAHPDPGWIAQHCYVEWGPA